MNVRNAAFVSLLPMLGVNAHGTIFRGTGFGTYYYDVEQVDACGTSFVAQNSGSLECSPQTALSLDQVNSNYVVAMNHSQLVSDMVKFCGKKVVVTVNGRQSDLPLFIGDGCQRCGDGSPSSNVWDPVGAPGLDFSYSTLKELYGEAACADGHVPISWEIVDDTIYDFSNGASSIRSTVAASNAQSASSAAFTMSISLPETVSSQTLHVSNAPQSKSFNASASEACKSTTSRNLNGPCPTGAWQCNGITLEQCLTDTWTPRITCGAGMACQGGSYPYCIASQSPPSYERR